MRCFALAVGITLLMDGAAPAAPSPDTARQTRLEAGDTAPDFALPGSDGKVHRLADHRGKRAVVLAWFARAFSAG